MSWLKNCLNSWAQRVVIHWHKVCVEAGNSQCAPGGILGLILINIFINDLDGEAECTVCRFANGTKLGLGTDTPEGCAPIQRDMKKLQAGPDRNLIKFYKGTPAPVNAEDGLTGKQHDRKSLGILLDMELSICQHALAAKKASDILGCIGAMLPAG